MCCFPSALKVEPVQYHISQDKTASEPSQTTGLGAQMEELRETTGLEAQMEELVESRGPSIRLPKGLLSDFITFTFKSSLTSLCHGFFIWKRRIIRLP